jgi:hypothetical protein
VVGGALAYPVARKTAKATVQSAEISAAVERERLAHESRAWSASRRDKAAEALVRLNEQMEVVGNTEILTTSRERAARDARDLLFKVVLTLRNPDDQSPRTTGLVRLLAALDLEAAALVWSVLREPMMEGRLT